MLFRSERIDDSKVGTSTVYSSHKIEDLVNSHNDNPVSHNAGIKDLLAIQNFYVNARTFNHQGDTKNNPWSIAIKGSKVTDDFGYGNVTLNARLDPTNTDKCSSILFNTILIKDTNTVENFKDLGSISAQVLTPSSNSFESIGEIGFLYSKDKNSYGVVLKNVGIDSSVNSLSLWQNSLESSKPIDIGSSSHQFKNCYLQTSPIVVSDSNLKQGFEEIPESVYKAWGKIKFQTYKFKEAVLQKGESLARKHIGLVAQSIIEAFEEQGLNAFDYGLICQESWEDEYQDELIVDQEEVLDAKGNILEPRHTHIEHKLIVPAGTLLSVRYEEVLALEAAYQRYELNKLKELLTTSISIDL